MQTDSQVGRKLTDWLIILKQYENSPGTDLPSLISIVIDRETTSLDAKSLAVGA